MHELTSSTSNSAVKTNDCSHLTSFITELDEFLDKSKFYRPVAAHSGCLDPEKFLSTIDVPPGFPGVPKNHIYFFTNETVFLLR